MKIKISDDDMENELLATFYMQSNKGNNRGFKEDFIGTIGFIKLISHFFEMNLKNSTPDQLGLTEFDYFSSLKIIEKIQDLYSMFPEKEVKDE